MGVKVREKQKGSGVWWVFINHQGQRKAKKVGAKSAANKVARRIEAKLASKELNIDTEAVPTFGELAREWIGVIVPATCKPSTCSDYEGILKHHVLPAFKARPIDNITRKEIKVFILNMAKRRSMSKAKHCKAVLSGVLKLAVEDEVISHNPALELGSLGKQQQQEATITPFTAEELDLLLDTFRAKFPHYFPLTLCLARTGMRIGEAVALEWGDIDFNSRTIHIRRASARGRIQTPKSGKSRKVDMSLQLTEVLGDMKTRRKREALARGLSKVPELVFMNTAGRMIDINHFRNRTWHKALTKAKLARRRVHDLRHTYATLRIQAGHNIADVSGQLGHHSVKFTLDQYFHWLPGQAKGEVDELDRLQLPATYAQPDEKTG